MALHKRTPAPAAVAAIRVLDERLNELRTRRKACTAEIIALEAQGAVPTPTETDAAPKLHVDALALLAGDAIAPEAVEPSINVRVYKLFHEREIIDEALRVGEQKLFRARVEARAEIAHDIATAWTRNIQHTAAALETLEELAQERVRLMSEFAIRTGLPQHTLDCSGQAQRAAGPRIVGDAAYVFLQAARAAGFIE
jgi:hypothetical protein